MRIVYLSSSVIPSQKANSIQVIKMCSAFSQAGHDVTLFARFPQKDFLEKLLTDTNSIKDYYGIKNVFPIQFIKASSLRLFGGLEYGFKVLKKIKELKINPNIIYGRNLYALIACLKLNKPVIYESHIKPVWGKNILEKILFSNPNFKRLVVINKALYRYYKENYTLFKNFPEKLLLAPDGADIFDRNDISSDLSLNNKKLCIKKKHSEFLKEKCQNNNIQNFTKSIKATIGYAGSLYPGKGIETIVEIAKIMPEHNFIIAGGTESQIEYYKKNTNLKNILFIGFLKPSDIHVFLSNCDILLAPYSDKVYSENFKDYNLVNWMSPLKIFEYMASCKPIIASDLPAIREILKNNKTAILVNHKSVFEWKKAIDKLLKSQSFANQLSENAFVLLKKNYTWSKRVNNILDGLPQRISAKQTILHIIGDLNIGGAERSLLKLLPELNKDKYEHKILTLFELGRLANDFKNKGLEVYSAFIPKTINLYSLKAVLRLIKLIKQINPVIIQTWLYHSNNIINIISPFLKNIPLINCIRHNDPLVGSFKTKFSSKLGAFLSKFKNNHILYCSKSSFDKHLNNGYPQTKSTIIKNGFVIPNINKKKAQINLRNEFHIPKDYKLAITVGRYCKEKDFPNLLKAIKIVSETDNKIVCLLCGKNLDENNYELTSLIKHLKIDKNVRLLGSKTEIEGIMAGADFLVSSSSSESFPNVIAESMSVATPCIVTNVGESANIVGNTGIISRPCDSKQLAEAILKVINMNDSDLKLLGNKAKERIEQNYSLEKCVNQYKHLYQSILSFP